MTEDDQRFEDRMRMSEESSMLFWWPKIQGLDIPVPKTRMLMMPKFNIFELIGSKPCSDEMAEMMRKFTVDLKLIAREVQRNKDDPVFMRSDQCSGKHEWKNTCFVEDVNDIRKHLLRLMEYNEMVGWMSFTDKAIAVREFIPLESSFVAFHGLMPVAKERRYFVRDGVVECRHEYWIEAAIRQGLEGMNLPESEWLHQLRALNQQSNYEIGLLTKYAESVGKELGNYWSVDFAKAKDGRWLLIDLARGELSFHVDGCPHAVVVE